MMDILNLKMEHHLKDILKMKKVLNMIHFIAFLKQSGLLLLKLENSN